jgi:transposase
MRGAAEASYYRRLLAILEIDQGKTIAEVADTLGVTRQTVHNWIRSYQGASDPDDLRDHYGVGRPSLWTEQLQGLLQTSLEQRPVELGYAAMNWTVPLLQEHLYRRTDQWLSDDTIRRKLDDLGYVWKRFRYVLPPDPEREKKTRYPSETQEFAAAEREAGRGRDRPALLPAAAGRLGLAWPAGPGADQRRQRQARPVRDDQPGDGAPAVPGPAAAAGRRLPGILG